MEPGTALRAASRLREYYAATAKHGHEAGGSVYLQLETLGWSWRYWRSQVEVGRACGMLRVEHAKGSRARRGDLASSVSDEFEEVDTARMQ